MSNTSNEPKLTPQRLDTIKQTISVELLKRGFLSPITITEEVGRYPLIKVVSESFQTTPVIMKSLKISNSNGNIQEETKTRQKHNGDKFEETIYKIWIPVHVDYEHFDGGSNGCNLFTLTGWVSNGDFDDRIYDLVIR